MRPPSDGVSIKSTMVIGPSGTNVHAVLEDLDSTAKVLFDIADTCKTMSTQVVAIGWNVPLASDLLSPVTAAIYGKDITDLTVGPTGLVLTGIRAACLGLLLTVSAEEYRRAEVVAGMYVDMARIGYDATRLAGVALYAIVRAQPGFPTEATPEVSDLIPETIDAGTRLLEDILPGSYGTVMSVVGGKASEIAYGGGPVTATLAHGPSSDSAVPAATSLADGARRTAAMYEDADKAAHIQIQRTVDPATGKGAWTVFIPGTQHWGLLEANPLDASGNLIAPSGKVTPTEDAIVDALHQAMAKECVDPSSEPVMLVGHSQGGMVATNLARHAARSKQFKVTSVVTFGSPVAQFQSPPGVKTLNIENKLDPVPRLDADRTGAGDPRRTRVVIDAPDARFDRNGERTVTAPHDMGTYARTYESVAAHSRPDSPVGQFESATRHHFHGDARTYLFDVQRQPKAK